ncbi:aldo/keto reductase [Arthrobacter pascens]|uniref:aldo/keto reductase n=1 Tax=Arthrobacter pascens TaxID=1677 RepID=UPI0033741614
MVHILNIRATGEECSAVDNTVDGGAAKTEHRYMQEEVLERVQELKPLAEEAGLSMAAFAVAWVLQNQNVSSALVGASRPEQLRDNVTAAGVRLDPALLSRVDAVLGDLVERDPAKVESFPERV